jgi:hypothetical protein
MEKLLEQIERFIEDLADGPAVRLGAIALISPLLWYMRLPDCHQRSEAPPGTGSR